MPGMGEMWFIKIIFAGEQKCLINHSCLGFCVGMVVTNSIFILEKFLITVFPLKNFFISLLKFIKKSEAHAWQSRMP